MMKNVFSILILFLFSFNGFAIEPRPFFSQNRSIEKHETVVSSQEIQEGFFPFQAIQTDKKSSFPLYKNPRFLTKRFLNAKLLLHHQISKGELWVHNGKIISPQPRADITIDLKDGLIAPGFIDLQINGGFGVDFAKDPEKVEVVAKLLPQFGVTAFFPTLVSSSPKDYKHAIPLLQPRSFKDKGAATILGIHLEGPFFSPKFNGAHHSDLILTSYEQASLESVYGNLQGVKIVTLAPELPGATDLIKQLKSKNIIVSAGHSNANFDEMQEGIKAGVVFVTHLFNAMRPFHHRDSGIIGSALFQPRLFYSVIADGMHVSSETIALCWRCNPKGLILVTDATAGLGLPKGKYQLGSKEIEVHEGHVYLLGTQTLAGSALSLDAAVRRLRAITKCSTVEALEAASLKPAQLIRAYPSKGSLEIGADADFLILSDDLFVQASYIDGELAWKR